MNGKILYLSLERFFKEGMNISIKEPFNPFTKMKRGFIRSCLPYLVSKLFYKIKVTGTTESSDHLLNLIRKLEKMSRKLAKHLT